MKIIDYQTNAIKNKKEVSTIEQFYVNGVIENLEQIIDNKKNAIIDSINEYVEKHKDGNQINSIIINNYFFKPINPLANKVPTYSAEKLALVWNLYEYLVFEVNLNIGNYTPTITGFCRFAGISTSTLNLYENNFGEDMKILIDKIKDVCFDDAISMAQIGNLKERTTMYRMGSEMGKSDKPQPITNNNTLVVNFEEIDKRLNQYNKFTKVKALKNDK